MSATHIFVHSTKLFDHKLACGKFLLANFYKYFNFFFSVHFFRKKDKCGLVGASEYLN